MRMKRQAAYQLGLRSEMLAAWYLRAKGYRVLSMRYRNHQGEIDIVAKKGATLVAVEVKARATLDQCAETVTPHKQEKIARAVSGLLAQGKFTGLEQTPNIRFDVIWIAPRRWPKHIKDAWRL